MTAAWHSLPAGIRAQVDGYVLQDAPMLALRTLCTSGRALGIGLNEAQLLVHERYVHFGDRVARTPDSPIDLDSLAVQAAGLPGRIVAVEAVWDGDTFHDWFVVLRAVTDEPAGDHPLATVYSRMGGSDAATASGTALAAHLGVPFHFGAPDDPGYEAPRRRDLTG